jgi:hypothetical protein
MDADDVAYPHRFAALLEDWEKAGRPDVFGSGADYINEDGKDLWSVAMPLDDATIRAAICAPGGIMAIMHPTVMLRKTAVLSCGGYDPYFKIAQDNDLWLRMTTLSRFGNSPHRLLKYRFQPGSDTAMAIKGSRQDLRGCSSWMKLLSLQKKLLIDAGEEERWNSCREQIVSELMKRIDVSTLQAEEFVSRSLTEAKILIYSQKRVDGIIRLASLCHQCPAIVLKRLAGRKMTNIFQYLMSLAELKQVTRQC